MDEQDHDSLANERSTSATGSLAERKESIRRFMEDLDALAKELGAAWPSGLTAVEAVRNQRRQLINSEWVTLDGETSRRPAVQE